MFYTLNLGSLKQPPPSSMPLSLRKVCIGSQPCHMSDQRCEPRQSPTCWMWCCVPCLHFGLVPWRYGYGLLWDVAMGAAMMSSWTSEFMTTPLTRTLLFRFFHLHPEYCCQGNSLPPASLRLGLCTHHQFNAHYFPSKNLGSYGLIRMLGVVALWGISSQDPLRDIICFKCMVCM